jgi:CO dehydrogenase nickel-insertion accessory protein CooC1
LLGELEANGTTVVCDMEAGIGTVLRLEPGQVDRIVVIAEPSAKAIEVARRSLRIAESRAAVSVVANKVRDPAELAEVRATLGVEPFVVPADGAIEQADRDGVAPIDSAPDSPAVRALLELAARLSD